MNMKTTNKFLGEVFIVVGTLSPVYCFCELTGSFPCNRTNQVEVILHSQQRYGFYRKLGISTNVEQNKTISKESTSDGQRTDPASYPYLSTYNYQISKTVQQVSWNKFYVGLITHVVCSTNHIQELIAMLKDLGKMVLCTHMELKNYDVTGIMFDMAQNKVSTIVFLLPWYLTENMLHRIAHHHIDPLVFVTIELNLSFLRDLQEENPFMIITNLMEMTEEKEKMIDISNCMVVEYDEKVKSSGEIMACTEKKFKVMRVVTTFLERDIYVREVVGILPKANRCLSGVPCKKPVIKNGKTTHWKSICCDGLHVELLKIISNILKVPFEVYQVEDNKFGTKINGEWNGMIGDVYRGKADLAMQQITVLAKRFTDIDYTYHVVAKVLPVAIVLRNTDEYVVVNWAFISSMKWDLLLGMLVAAMVMILSLYVLENIGYSCGYNDRYPFRESLSYITGVLFQRDLGGALPKLWSGQVISIVYAFGMTIAIGTYTAQLTATNVDKGSRRSFEGFNDPLFQNSKNRIGVTAGSTYEILVDEQGMKAQKMTIVGTSYTYAVDRMLNDSMEAMVGQYDYLETVVSTKKEACENLAVFRIERLNEDIAFATQKESLLGHRISEAILKMHEDGVLQRIINKWEKTRRCEVSKHQKFPWEYCGGLIVIIGGTVAFCVLIVLAENLYTYFKVSRGKSSGDSDKASPSAGMRNSGFSN